MYVHSYSLNIIMLVVYAIVMCCAVLQMKTNFWISIGDT